MKCTYCYGKYGCHYARYGMYYVNFFNNIGNTHHGPIEEINMLTVGFDYSCSNRENLTLSIQMQLSKKTKNFAAILLHVWNLHQIFNILCFDQKKMSVIA